MKPLFLILLAVTAHAQIGALIGRDTLLLSSGNCEITTTSLPNGTVGTPYSSTLTTLGCTAVTWSISVGSLPYPLTLNSSTGTISGTPSSIGTSNFTASTGSSIPNNATQPLSITIGVGGSVFGGTAIFGGSIIMKANWPGRP